MCASRLQDTDGVCADDGERARTSIQLYRHSAPDPLWPSLIPGSPLHTHIPQPNLSYTCRVPLASGTEQTFCLALPLPRPNSLSFFLVASLSHTWPRVRVPSKRPASLSLPLWPLWPLCRFIATGDYVLELLERIDEWLHYYPITLINDTDWLNATYNWSRIIFRPTCQYYLLHIRNFSQNCG